MFSGKTIFISPLDWGFGHATRCVPLIKQLSEHNTVIVGTSVLNHDLFQKQFPELQKINVPSYNVRYSRYWPAWLKLILQAPGIRKSIDAEHKAMDQIMSAYHPDVIISDNRFGLHHPDAQNIFITHQLQVKAPFLESLANRMNQAYIHRFDEVWVPDYEAEDQRLAGELSHSRNMKLSVYYLGPQSALQLVTTDELLAQKIDQLILLSGAEPQRTLLEHLLLKKLANTSRNVVLVRGSHTPLRVDTGHVQTIDFATGEKLKALIVNAETIICRSGYSTLMDLHLLGKKKIILIPTPGQTEQEYLAKYWQKKMDAEVYQQNNLHRLKLPA